MSRDSNGYLSDTPTCTACDHDGPMRPQGSGVNADNTSYETFVCPSCGSTETF